MACAVGFILARRCGAAFSDAIADRLIGGSPQAQVRHGMVEKTPNPCRMSSGNRWVYTTFAIELETLR